MKNEILDTLKKWTIDGKIDQHHYEDMATELAGRLAKNLHNPPVSDSLPLALAVEFGYKQCEKGNNIQMALIELGKVIGNDR